MWVPPQVRETLAASRFLGPVGGLITEYGYGVFIKQLII